MNVAGRDGPRKRHGGSGWSWRDTTREEGLRVGEGKAREKERIRSSKASFLPSRPVWPSPRNRATFPGCCHACPLLFFVGSEMSIGTGSTMRKAAQEGQGKQRAVKCPNSVQVPRRHSGRQSKTFNRLLNNQQIKIYIFLFDRLLFSAIVVVLLHFLLQTITKSILLSILNLPDRVNRKIKATLGTVKDVIKYYCFFFSAMHRLQNLISSTFWQFSTELSS
jgi:hypothetical protein